MKFIFFSLVLCVTLLSCNPNNPTPNPPAPNSVQTSWTLTVDNKTYSWSDTYVENENGNWFPEHIETNPGLCSWQYSGSFNGYGGIIYLSTGNLPGNNDDELVCELEFYPNNTGSFTINQTSSQNPTYPCFMSLEVSDYPLTNNLWFQSYWTASNINLNITNFATTKGGLVKGNISGTFTDFNSQVHTISGQFNAIRKD